MPAKAITFPQRSDKGYRGIFPGRIYGDIVRAFNLDFKTEPGRMGISRRQGTPVVDSVSLATLDIIDAFLRINSDGTERWWGIGRSGDAFNATGTSPLSGWAKDALTGTPADCLDAVRHETNAGEERMIVSRATDLAILNAYNHDNAWVSSWWTRVSIASSTNAAPIEITTSADHGFATGDIIRISGHETNTAANGTWVITKVSATKFTLTGSTGVGVGGATGTCGYLNQAAMTSGVHHPLDNFNRVVIVGDKNFIHTIDRNDVIEYKKLTLPYYLTATFIFHTKSRVWISCKHDFGGNGVVIEWDGYSSSHLYEHSVDATAALGGIELNDVPYVVSSAGYVKYYNGSSFVTLEFDGLPVKIPFEGVEMSSGMTTPTIAPRGMAKKDGRIYILANNTTTSNVQILRKMMAGVWCLDVGARTFFPMFGIGQGNGVDFGQAILSDVGALISLPEYRTTNEFLGSAIVYDVYTGTTKKIVFSTGGIQSTVNRAFFETARIFTDDISDMWELVWFKFRKFYDSNGKIVVKSRSAEPYQDSSSDFLKATITWVNTTSFTAVVPTGVAVGDEVEIMAGDNAGCLFHISVLSATPDGAATITVTIDEAAPNSSTSAALARFDNWKKIGTIDSSTKTYDKLPVQQNSNFVELKVELRGTFFLLDEMVLTTKSNETKIKAG